MYPQNEFFTMSFFTYYLYHRGLSNSIVIMIALTIHSANYIDKSTNHFSSNEKVTWYDGLMSNWCNLSLSFYSWDEKAVLFPVSDLEINDRWVFVLFLSETGFVLADGRGGRVD